MSLIQYSPFPQMPAFSPQRLTDEDAFEPAQMWLLGHNELAYSDELYNQFNINFPDSFHNARSIRKREFLAGRLVAMTAVQSFTKEWAQVGIGDFRQPLWPKEIFASITHSAEHALALVCQSKKPLLVGIDLEPLISPTVAQDISEQVLTGSERNMIDEWMGQLEWTFSEVLTLIFSAKESLFKGVFPWVNCYLDFSDSAVAAIDLNTQLVIIEPAGMLKKLLPNIPRYEASFQHTDKEILTFITQKT